eukprot:scaffold45581_cov73-Phaeocystis_antarctica.AAC.3
MLQRLRKTVGTLGQGSELTQAVSATFVLQPRVTLRHSNDTLGTRELRLLCRHLPLPCHRLKLQACARPLSTQHAHVAPRHGMLKAAHRGAKMGRADSLEPPVHLRPFAACKAVLERPHRGQHGTVE